MAEIARTGQRYPSGETGGNYPTGDNYPRDGRVGYPSSRYRTVSAGNLFSLSIPDNWRQVSNGQNSVTFAPQGAYGNVQGQFVFSHGAMVGAANVNGNLRQASDQFVNALLQNNPHLRLTSGYQRVNIDGRPGLVTQVAGRSPVLGQNEIANIYTVQLRDGSIGYVVGVAPQNDYNVYQRTFNTIVSSINFNY